jgi:hypothetical protein
VLHDIVFNLAAATIFVGLFLDHHDLALRVVFEGIDFLSTKQVVGANRTTTSDKEVNVAHLAGTGNSGFAGTVSF